VGFQIPILTFVIAQIKKVVQGKKVEEEKVVQGNKEKMLESMMMLKILDTLLSNFCKIKI